MVSEPPPERNPKFARSENPAEIHRRLVAHTCGDCGHYFAKYCDRLNMKPNDIAESGIHCPLPNGRAGF
jgi:hypothetical protein